MYRFIVTLASILVASTAVAQTVERHTTKIELRVLTGDALPGWKVVPGATDRDLTAVPADTTSSDALNVSECPATQSDCLSTCDGVTADNYLYFFNNNEPPATRRKVARTDGLFELRADGRFDRTETWLAVALLCSKSGLAIVAAQSSTLDRAKSVVDAFMSTVQWHQ